MSVRIAQLTAQRRGVRGKSVSEVEVGGAYFRGILEVFSLLDYSLGKGVTGRGEDTNIGRVTTEGAS